MRQLSANIQALIANDQVNAFYNVLVQHYGGGFIHFNTTSHTNDVTFSNGQTFLADGKLKAADPPKLNTNVDREEYKLILSDPDFAEGGNIGQGLVGKILEVRLGFINPATGRPYTDIVDTFLMYKGRINGSAYLVDTDEEETDLQLSGVSPMAALEMSKGFYISRDNVRQNDETDGSCDAIYEGSSAITLKWGKK